MQLNKKMGLTYVSPILCSFSEEIGDRNIASIDKKIKQPMEKPFRPSK
jgi:hypothetical protein